MPRLWRTLAFQLTAWYALSALILVFLATGSLYFVLLVNFDRNTDLFLSDKLNVLRTILRERPNDWDGLREEVELESAARQYQRFYIQLLDERGRPLLATPGMEDQLDIRQLVLRTEDRGKRDVPMRGKHGQAFRVSAATAPAGSAAHQVYTILIAIDVSHENELLAGYRSWFLGVLAVAFVVCPVIGYNIARRGIKPLEAMAATTRRITSSNLRERIVAAGYPLELASLAETFNSMLNRLEDSFERISTFSADIAHDLRTPVNNIRGEAEVALARARSVDEYREVVESCLEGAVHLSDLISNLLFLARSESPLAHLNRERVDIRELLAGVCEFYEASAAEGDVSLSSPTNAEPLMAELDRTLMKRAVGNLVSNALAHTPPGGSVQLTAFAGEGSVRIEVADTGDGIPADALPRVFDRFFRVDPARSQASGSTGLGLAIVQGIMSLHGGQAEIVSQPGQGTRVTLHLPFHGAVGMLG